MSISLEQQRKKTHQKVVQRIVELVSTMTAFVVIFSILITISNWSAYSLILQDLIDPQAMANSSQVEEHEYIQSGSFPKNQKPVPTPFIAPIPEKNDHPFSLEGLGELYPSEMRLEIPKVFQDTIPVRSVDKEDFDFEDLYTSENAIQEALQEGVVHYPYTANPDQFGNVFITGHSSYYAWGKGKYKDIFALLHKLSVGDDYYLYFEGKKYHYQVTDVFEILPNDISVLEQPVDQKISTIMTCTPIGTTLKRLIVRARLVGEGA